MSTLALILARAGSKGLPRKHERPIAGRPCIAWTLDDALDAQRRGVIDRVALSTDGPSLARIAMEMGVEIVQRPADLASDHATVDDAARHAVRILEARGSPDDLVVILYANVPIRPEGLIERAVRLVRDSSADSAQSYQPVGKHHPWWTAVVEQGGAVRPWEGPILNHGVYRRQDLPPAHVPDGGVLVVTRRALFHEVPNVPPGPHAFFGLDRRGVINPAGSVVDIDTEIDAMLAEVILTNLHARTPA